MKNQNFMPSSVPPYEYAEYLEHLSNDEFWQLAYEKAAITTNAPAEQTQTNVLRMEQLTCVVCSLRNGQCLLPLTDVREILPPTQAITLLPDVPPWMLGILAWRGETLAAIDLCAYITQTAPPAPKQRVTLVMQYENISLALCVLAIDAAVITINTSQIVPLPDEKGASSMLGAIAGTWEATPTRGEQGALYVLNIPAFFPDIVQRIERKKKHG